MIVYVLITARVIQLFYIGIYNFVAGIMISIVDAGLAYIQAKLGNRREVLNGKYRVSLASNLCYRAHNQSVAVGKLQVTIDPGISLFRHLF